MSFNNYTHHKHSKEYDDYIRSEAWLKKKAERLELDDNRCVMCGRTADQTKRKLLTVHHITYRNLTHEPMDDLCSLCDYCHIHIHNYYDRYKNWADKKCREDSVANNI